MKSTSTDMATFVRNNIAQVTVAIFICVAFILSWFLTLATSDVAFEHYVWQAQGFVHGSLYLVQNPPVPVDYSPGLHGTYWPLGPLPAFFLTPLVALGGVLPWQTVLNVLFTPLAFVLAYLVARKRNLDPLRSQWLALAFTFGSVYLGVTVRAASWQFSSAVVGILGLWGVLEYLGKRRFWLLGMLIGCALTTRFTAGLALFGFVTLAQIFETKPFSKVPSLSKKTILRQMVLLAVPIVLAGGLLLWMNHVRTGDMWDNGYLSANINADTKELRNRFGLFSLQNVPTNLYYYFLAPPRILNDPGSYHLHYPFVAGAFSMGFFLLSPLFLLLFAARPRGSVVWAATLAAGAVTVLLLTYFSVNVAEFGPRYLIDVMPLWYVVLLGVAQKDVWSRRLFLLIAASVMFNLHLATTLYFVGR